MFSGAGPLLSELSCGPQEPDYPESKPGNGQEQRHAEKEDFRQGGIHLLFDDSAIEARAQQKGPARAGPSPAL